MSLDTFGHIVHLPASRNGTLLHVAWLVCRTKAAAASETKQTAPRTQPTSSRHTCFSCAVAADASCRAAWRDSCSCAIPLRSCRSCSARSASSAARSCSLPTSLFSSRSCPCNARTSLCMLAILASLAAMLAAASDTSAFNAPTCASNVSL